MSRFDTLLWVGLLLPACGGDGCRGAGNDSSDGDDSNPCHGLNDSVDADGDGLSELDECMQGSDDDEVDSDSDGLSDLDEFDLGTDPRDADSDDDGISDYDEVHPESGLSTDPADHCSRPDYEGGWGGVGWCCDSLSATSDEVGGIPENFSGLSQHGEEVELYSFCDRPAVLIISSFDDPFGEFSDHIGTYTGLYEDYADDGLMVLLFVYRSTDESRAEFEDLEHYTSTFGITFPVVLDEDELVPEWIDFGYTGGTILMSRGLMIADDIAVYGATEADIKSVLGVE